MNYAKIIVKNNYEQRGDLVLRSYIRALRKVKAELLLDGENALIYGVIDDNNKFHELFTNEIINYDNYISAGIEEIVDVFMMSDDSVDLLNKIMQKILFNKNISLDFEISSMEDLARDRAVEFDAYNTFLSRINPYQRLNDTSINAYNDYNSFIRKIEEIKIMKKMDNQKEEFDEYEVLENPKKLIRK